MALERVQKILARAGLASRRQVEEWIREGRVTVNGQVVALGAKADPEKDAIKVDGKRVKLDRRLRYVLLYKPAGVVTTSEDPEGRTTVVDLVRGKVSERVFPVGRLDYHSEGLLLLTNDGELAYRLAHPRFGVLRAYLVKVKGLPDEKDVSKLKKGTVIEGKRVVPKEVQLVRTTPKQVNSWWRVVVGEGKSHEVREFFLRVGHPVQRLVRVAIGPLRDEKLKAGVFRGLTAEEVEALYKAVGLKPSKEARHGRTTGTGLYQEAGGVRARQTHRRSATGTGGAGHRQAGVKRKSPGHLT